MSLLNLYRRRLIVEIMSAFWVAEHLDVIEHVAPSILPSAVDPSLDPLPFQQLKKAFRHCVVMTVSRRLMLLSQLLAYKKLCPLPRLNWPPSSE